MNEERFLNLLDKLIAETEHLQNNPAEVSERGPPPTASIGCDPEVLFNTDMLLAVGGFNRD
jgi:hypothetical protein